MALKLTDEEITNHFARFKQGNMNQLIDDVNTLGDIRILPVVAAGPDAVYIPIPHRVALFNTKCLENDFHGFMDFVSDEYELIQPRENFNVVLNALINAGVQEGAWTIRENGRGNLASMNFLFKTMYQDPTGSDCFPGVQISSESSGKGAVYMEFFWWRKTCSNGAKGNRIVEAVRIEHRGGQERINEQIAEFLQRQAVGEKRLFTEILPDAYGDLVEGERAWLLIANLESSRNKNKELRKAIMDRFVAGTEKNRLALFNIATDIIGKQGDSFESADRNLDLAENILMNRPAPRTQLVR